MLHQVQLRQVEYFGGFDLGDGSVHYLTGAQDIIAFEGEEASVLN
jgi:hypothetical protein